MSAPAAGCIVVADDDDDIRGLIVFALERRGYRVHEAASGDVALELVRNVRPDLVVLDVMMPGLTGLEVARRLAADPATAGLPILILSAQGQAAEVDAGLGSGAWAYMIKPFQPRELGERVNALLAAARGEAACAVDAATATATAAEATRP
jgi:DNA-binding response OmpR family regulator